MNTSLNYNESKTSLTGEMEFLKSSTRIGFLDYIEEPEAWQLDDLDDVVLNYEWYF
jgi:hypothetical protein